MKFTNFQRKSVSLIVLATFVALLHFWATPAPAATIAGNSETAIAQRDSGGPSFIEEESTEPVIKKAKKFPWLFIGLGVVVIGVAVYFLVIKKPKYTLTVTLGTGCTGTPAATAKFKKGESVPYNYSPQAGYGNLQVKLDGVAVAASGTVAMDKAHTLEVSASKEFTLTVNLGTGTTGTPSATAKYKEGQIVNYSYAAQAGYSNPQVKLDGAAVGTSGNIIMDKDKALTVTAEPLYTLTVTLGTGCTGTPAANGTYNKGTVVNYIYIAQAGYYNLQVKLDGVAAGTSGNIIMDKDHTLDVTAAIDIRGNWTFNFVATNTVKNWSWAFGFTGDGKTGPVMIYLYPGTYTVSGNNVTWKFTDYNISGTGAFTGINSMSGTATFSGVEIGGVEVTAAIWAATRTGTTAHCAAPKTSAETISRK